MIDLCLIHSCVVYSNSFLIQSIVLLLTCCSPFNTIKCVIIRFHDFLTFVSSEVSIFCSNLRPHTESAIKKCITTMQFIFFAYFSINIISNDWRKVKLQALTSYFKMLEKMSWVVHRIMYINSIGITLLHIVSEIIGGNSIF